MSMTRGTCWHLLLAFAPLLAGCTCGASVQLGDGRGGDSDGGSCGASRPCSADQLCVLGGCHTPKGTCSTAADCADDTRCLEGHCFAWKEFPALPYDDKCTREVKVGVLRPQLQCSWEDDPEKAQKPLYHAVRHTPLVADFKLGDVDRQLGPSIVVIADATYTEGVARGCESSGSLIILDGRSCKKLYVVGGAADRVAATVTPAIADLDGDGRPEIIAPAPEGGLLAFSFDAKQKTWVRLWRSSDSSGPSMLGSETCLWGGITVADLDGGAPEVLFHGTAHDAKGKVLASIPGYKTIPWGNPMTVADVDLDGKPEVVEGNGTFKYTPGSGFSLIAGWVGTGDVGFTAVADFGDFPGAAGDAPGRPEVVVVDGNGVRLQTILGQVVFSAAGGYGSGGPPTVADFDGDGKPEIGVAYGDKYVVYRVACKGTPAGCAGDGILWSTTSQDKSSAKTGSSVFDFNGDGRADVVYGDECFVRVYDGPSGKVLFSQGRSSSTWEENVTIADVDGDAAAEIVLSASGTCSPSYCGLLDETFAGLPCQIQDDCPGGGCDAGLCRCVSDTQCGGVFSCTTPITGTAGSGNVCRTQHSGCAPGIRVYRDAHDRWAGSRRIWNQHAYSVTNIGDDGVVPSVGQVKRNWEEKGLNNFRQNVQGSVGPMPAPDLTTREVTITCTQGQTQVTLSATVCNRGATGCDAGVQVAIRETSSGNVLCAATTKSFLDAGQCETVSCTAAQAPQGSVQAVVNLAGTVAECNVSNNASAPATPRCVF
jgi:hypothetical protein